MQYNLFSPFGARPLQYPHYTKWDDKTGVVNIVTQPDSIIKEGDEIFVAMESKDISGNISYSYFNKPAIVTGIIEHRKAKGEHKIPFDAIFQKVSIL
jgi:hypothetical protein